MERTQNIPPHPSLVCLHSSCCIPWNFVFWYVVEASLTSISTKLTCVKNDISRYVDELLNTAFLRGGHVAQQWQVYCRFRFLKTFFRLITGLSQESVTAEATLSNYSSQHWKIKWPEWNLAVQISYLGWLWQWQTANSSTNPEGFPNRW